MPQGWWDYLSGGPELFGLLDAEGRRYLRVRAISALCGFLFSLAVILTILGFVDQYRGL